MFVKPAIITLWILALYTVMASNRRITRWGYDVNSEFVQAVRGPSTDDIYSLETLTGGEAVVSRISSTTELTMWAKRMTLLPSFKSLAINHDETKL